MKPALFIFALFLLAVVFAAEFWIHLTLFLLALLPPLLVIAGVARFRRWNPILTIHVRPVEIDESKREEMLKAPLTRLDSVLLRLRFPRELQLGMELRNAPIVLATALIPGTIVFFYLRHHELLLQPMEPAGSSLYLKLLMLCYLMALFFIALASRWFWERSLISYGATLLAPVQYVSMTRQGCQMAYEFRDHKGGFWGGTSNYYGQAPYPNVVVLFYSPKNFDWNCPTDSFIFHRFALLDNQVTGEAPDSVSA